MSAEESLAEHLRLHCGAYGKAEVPLCVPGSDGVPVADEVVARLLPAELHEAYDEAVVRCYLAEALSWRKCPAPGCELAVCCLSALPVDGTRPALDAVCRCGHRFCWACGREAHRPLRCEMIASWCDLCAQLDDDLATAAAAPPPSASVPSRRGGAAAHAARRRGRAARRPRRVARSLRRVLRQGRRLRQGDLFLRSADAMLGGRRALRLAQIVEYVLTLATAPAADADDEDGGMPPHPPLLTERLPLLQGAARLFCRRLSAVLELPSLPEPDAGDEGETPSADVPHVALVRRPRRRRRRRWQRGGVLRIGGEHAALDAHAKLKPLRLEPLSLLAQAADEKTREVRATIDQLVALTPAIGRPPPPAVEVEKEEEGLAGLAAGVGRKPSTLFGGAPM